VTDRGPGGAAGTVGTLTGGDLPERDPLAREGAPAGEIPAPQGLKYAVSTLLAWLKPVWPWIVLAVIGWIGWHELRQIDVSEVRALLRSTDVNLVLVLLAATAFNLMIFGLYDVAALGSLEHPPGAAARWSVGVVSFAWSNFLTLGPLAGPALRLWLYKSMGVAGERARAALTSILGALSIALGAWCAALSLHLPDAVDTFAVRVGLVVPLAALGALVLKRAPRLRLAPSVVRRWEGPPTTLVTIAAADWLAAWGVFHLAITGLGAAVSPRDTLGAFFLGQLIGLLSFVPGGLGSADAYWIYALTGAGGQHDRVLAALLLYRLVYYVVPWATATLILAGRLIRTGPRTGAFLRTAIASYTVLCGVVLLASAATPTLAERAAFLKRTVPLALIEVSHVASVLLGFLLLVISRGLARGYRSSHRMALALSVAGALTTFLKGLDFEEALISLVGVAILLVVHQPFERAGRLQPPLEFIVSVGLFAVVFFGAVGFGSLRSTPDIPSMLAHFGYRAHGARFLRGLLLLISGAAIAALHFALRARPHDALPGPSEIDAGLAEVARHARGTNPMLVACGDKSIFRCPGVDGFIAYRTAGRFLVAYSDPVCPAGAERDLLAAFLDRAAADDCDAILYQISAPFLPVAHDFGFSFFKLGEEAMVDLERFDLKGNKAKSWRHAINAVEKGGGRFALVPPGEIDPLLPDLRQVSDEWLADKHVVEKRFSIGRFDPGYLVRFPCALVRDEGGRIVGFANVLEGPRGEELSVDLMRYSARREETSGLHGVMDYLFLRLMIHGKEKGFKRFNLGMAPLASVGEVRWARPFERLAHLFFRHGETWYNYQGIRRYKEKFDPTWEPRYMAYPRPWDWPAASTTTAVLIAGGWRALLFPKGEAE
jgi:phosphatidylglycerol lysyltransferase